MGNYPGIDYGMGKVNIDHGTGMRYGVISIHKVLQAWADSSEPEYTYNCPYCGHEHAESWVNRLGNEVKYSTCRGCKKRLYAEDFNMQDIDPISFTCNQDGYQAQQSADDPDIFILKSPYYTYCQFCSPCAPGAGYLMDYFRPTTENVSVMISNPDNVGKIYKVCAENAGFIKAYCFGHNWFDDNKAPYPVFSIETGELVEA